MDMKKNPSLRGCLLVFAAGSLWGTIGLFVKELEQTGSTPGLTSLLRVMFAFLIMATACCAKYGIKALAIGRRTLLACALLGLVCHGVYNIFYSLAVTLAGVSVSAVLLNIAPVFTLLFSALLFGERITWTKAIAIILNIAGCILAATNGRFDVRALSVVGLLCGAGAGICYALTAIFGRLAAGKANSFVMSMYSYLFAAIFLALWTRPWQEPTPLNAGILIWSFLYALIPTAVAYVLYYQGLQSITESSKVPVIASVETVIATVIGVLLYHEHLGICSMIGIAFVLLSIIVMNITVKIKRTGRQ